MPRQTAAAKATLTRLWELAHDVAADRLPPVVLDTSVATPPGYAAWRLFAIPARDSVAVVLPDLRDDAPPQIARRYFCRVVSMATGQCPLCHGVAGLSQDPPGDGGGAAAWQLHDVVVRVSHAQGCPAQFGDDERRYFLPFADPDDQDQRGDGDGR